MSIKRIAWTFAVWLALIVGITYVVESAKAAQWVYVHPENVKTLAEKITTPVPRGRVVPNWWFGTFTLDGVTCTLDGDGTMENPADGSTAKATLTRFFCPGITITNLPLHFTINPEIAGSTLGRSYRHSPTLIDFNVNGTPLSGVLSLYWSNGRYSFESPGHIELSNGLGFSERYGPTGWLEPGHLEPFGRWAYLGDEEGDRVVVLN